MDSARVSVLNAFFPDTLKLSSDLRQMILDYVFPRKTYDIHWQDIKITARLGVTTTNGKCHGEIKVENEIVSTFDITRSGLASDYFEQLCDNIRRDRLPSNFNYDLDIIYRYVFCHYDEQTYRIQCLYYIPRFKNVEVFRMPKGTKGKLCYYTESFIIDEGAGRIFDKMDDYQSAISQYGNRWYKYGFRRWVDFFELKSSLRYGYQNLSWSEDE